MKKLIALLLTLAMCFALCACGESKKIEELEAFIAENPYSCEEGEVINTELYEKYQAYADELHELGVTADECEALKYAETVASLSEYIPHLVFIRVCNATASKVGEGFEIIVNALKAYNTNLDRTAFRDAVAYDAKACFDEAIRIANEHSDDVAVQVLIDCLTKLSTAANNYGGAIFGNHNQLVLDAIADTLETEKNVYIMTAETAVQFEKKISAINDQIKALE